ncbi:MAG: hypothetical protein WA705_21730 [Candidatus Ozemobacteraceae bacterium]
MKNHYRLGLHIATVFFLIIGWGTIGFAAPSGHLATAPCSLPDLDAGKYLNGNIRLSGDQMTIYWNLQSTSTLPKPAVSENEAWANTGGNPGAASVSSDAFKLDFDSLDIETFADVKIMNEINTVILKMKTNRKEDLMKVLEIIHTLDQPQKQVMIRIMIAEVSSGKTQDIHNRMRLLSTNLGGAEDLGVQTSVDHVTTSDSQQERETPGLKLILLKDQTFRNFLTAQEAGAQFELLSNPHVVVKHGEKAKIVIGRRIHVVKTETQVSGHANPIINYVDQDIGLEFNVTPYIYGNGHVGLDINQRVTDLISIHPNLKRSETSHREVQTFANAESGDTIVLGGLLQRRKNRTTQKVPGLSRIPLIGKLFNKDSQLESEVDLMVFITPIILDRPGMLPELASKQDNSPVCQNGSGKAGVSSNRIKEKGLK